MAMEKCHCIAINQFTERQTDDPKRKPKTTNSASAVGLQRLMIYDPNLSVEER